MNFHKCALSCLVALSLNNLAGAAGIGDWEASATAAGAGYINTSGIAAPVQEDIGVFDGATNGGVTYEFIYNADVGGASSAFMGSLSAPVGTSAGLKLDQFSSTGKFGVTTFGVADFVGVTPSVLNADTQVAYVANGTDMDLYVNGAFAETIGGASVALSGLTGIGHAYNHGNGGSIDPLNGTILGVAVYDSALSAEQVGANYAAFVPEPSSLVLFGLGLCGLALRCRRRD